MSTIGSRLREERLRIGLSQEEFAAVGGVLRRAQSNYESDERSPDARYLTAVAELGVDVLYVLRGIKAGHGGEAPTATSFDADERELIEDYRQLNPAGKASLQAFLTSCFNSGVMLQTDDSPRRAKRLAENRMAGLDERSADILRRAKAMIDEHRATQGGRKARQPKGNSSDPD
ncbi:transcriptional regulator [Burkholderia sp. Nafp2/4-1b]|uniref:helix-turn-helix domain-containing protein n=1 Tax=Burkholderia sp. Nafp2/4-1b TaxID=2116686 RepID=UPI000EF8CC4C|nr:helix-turn-helix transcriptional regulator [Burkholderia sp. Nafp2/4-1b]RKU01957.1 transcriptional regulator [Burkholderia sp. Nafp2/4-1b]